MVPPPGGPGAATADLAGAGSIPARRRGATRYGPVTMSDWRNTDLANPGDGDDGPVVTVSMLGDGDAMTMTFRGDGETFHSEKYGEGVRIPATLIDGSDLSGDDLPADGDDVTLVTWSSRLLAALADTFPDLDGETARIEKIGDGLEVDYSVMESDMTAPADD